MTYKIKRKIQISFTCKSSSFLKLIFFKMKDLSYKNTKVRYKIKLLLYHLPFCLKDIYLGG